MNKTLYIFTLLLTLSLCGQAFAQLPSNPWKPVPKHQTEQKKASAKANTPKAPSSSKTNTQNARNGKEEGLPANPWEKPSTKLSSDTLSDYNE